MGAITWKSNDEHCMLCGTPTDMVCCAKHAEFVCAPCYIKWQGSKNYCDFNWEGMVPWWRLSEQEMIEALREMELELR